MPGVVARNRLLTALAEVCAAHPIEEKILVGPSLSSGVQILDALARSGVPHVNLRPETVERLAREAVEDELQREGLAPLSRAQLLALVEEACDEVLFERSYFGALRTRPGLHRALQATLDEIHRAGLTTSELPEAAFEHVEKAREFRAIGSAYRAALERHGFVDATGILRRALTRLSSRFRRNGALPLVLLPSTLELTPDARRLLTLLAGGEPRLLPADPPEAWLEGKQVELTRAAGEENEVRAVLRRVLSEGVGLDEIELAVTDDDTYRPLIYELAQRHDVACTLQEGIPVIFSRPGQAVLDYLSWLEDRFPAETLARLLAAGRADLARIHEEGDSVGAARAARVLKQARIFFGRSRYLPHLDALIARLAAPHSGKEEPSPAAAAERTAGEVVRALVVRLLAFVPEVDAEGAVSFRALAGSAGRLVREIAAVASDLDGMAVKGLSGLFAEFEQLPERRLPLGEAVRRLGEAVRTLSVGSATPAPGALHVTRAASAGYSGRPLTFVLGLDASRVPGAILEDPVLLDHERRRVNDAVPEAHLPLPGAERADEAVRSLLLALSRMRGRVVLSYSDRDLLEEAERFPSAFLLRAFREARSEPDADYRRLDEALPPSEGFLVPAPRAPLDETEWWLTHLAAPGADRTAALAEVLQAYPWLRDGADAEEAREGDRFTPWDGLVGPDSALDPRASGTALSASRLEVLARCPHAYFLKYVLGLVPPEDPRPVDRWLLPTEFGNLLHEVLREFMVKLREAGELPSASRHADLLRDLAHRSLARWRRLVPPPSEAAFAVQESDLLAACGIFLELEEERAADATPRYFEVPFGLPDAELTETIASPDPVAIDLPGGEPLLLKGQIDRIDEIAPGSYEVWDYKSGAPRFFRDDLPVAGGRQVQPALYARAAERLLQKRGAARVVRSGYYFPTRKGSGRKMAPQVPPGLLEETLTDLLDLVASGAFVHTGEEDDCKFCDYHEICGGLERATARTEAKLGDPVLAPYVRIGERRA